VPFTQNKLPALNGLLEQAANFDRSASLRGPLQPGYRAQFPGIRSFFPFFCWSTSMPHPRALRLAFAAFCCVLPLTAQAATYFKIADEWGTIQPGGVRTGPSGIRFWNAEGANNGSFASTAPFRFYTGDIVSQANAQFGVGQWEVKNVNIVLSQSNAAFTTAGGIKLYWFENDSLPITNGEDDLGSAEPGHFSSLGTSQLRYQADANAFDTVLADGTTDATAIFGQHALVDSFQFTSSGSAGDWPLDVLAPQVSGDHQLINPEDPSILVGNPNYGIAPPIASPTRPFRSDTLANFDAYTDRVGTNLDISAIAADLAAGASAISFMLVADDATAATYKGNAFSGDYPARIYLEIEQLTSPNIPGDFDNNGIVNNADLAQWKGDFGVDGGSDANGDGLSDGADFLVWQRNYGAGSAAAAAATVPEPSTAVLVLFASVSLLFNLSRRRL
jgi:hypothetical protein